MTSKVVTVAFWAIALTTATLFSLLLGLNVVLVPLWLPIGMAVGVAARRASEWTCPSCHSEMAPPPADLQRELRAARRHGLLGRAAHGMAAPHTQ